MPYTNVTPPAGDRITVAGGRLQVPDHPVLPFIEGTTLSRAWNYSYGVGWGALAVGGTAGVGNLGLASMDVKGLYCPTRRSQFRPGIDESTMKTGWTSGGTDYGGCVGRHTALIGGRIPAPTFLLPTPGNSGSTLAVTYGLTSTTAGTYMVNGDTTTTCFTAMGAGIFGQMNQSTSYAAIRDGTSNTIMTGELQRITTVTGVPYNADNGPYLSQDAWAIGGVATMFTTGYNAGNTATMMMNNGYFPSPGSDHSNGANFGFADGSVKYLNTTLDRNIFALLGSMADKVPASPPGD